MSDEELRAEQRLDFVDRSDLFVADVIIPESERLGLDSGDTMMVYTDAYKEHLAVHGSFKKYIGFPGYDLKMRERQDFQFSKACDYLYFRER